MDFGTTISRYEIEGDKQPVAQTPPKPVSTSTNTVTAPIVSPESDPSETSLLPESIFESWGTINRVGMSVRMYGDLVRLASVPDGWRGPGSRALRARSLKSFLDFWALVRSEAKEPEITLAPDGMIHAEWFESNRKRLDARFSERGVVFGLFAQDKIVEGVDSVEVVSQILKLHGSKPLSWSHR
jgi:hypothetical protein